MDVLKLCLQSLQWPTFTLLDFFSFFFFVNRSFLDFSTDGLGLVASGDLSRSESVESPADFFDTNLSFGDFFFSSGFSLERDLSPVDLFLGLFTIFVDLDNFFSLGKFSSDSFEILASRDFTVEGLDSAHFDVEGFVSISNLCLWVGM